VRYSGSRGDFLITLRPRAPGPAARNAWRFLNGDCRRKHVQRDTLFRSILLILVASALDRLAFATAVGTTPIGPVAPARCLLTQILARFALVLLVGLGLGIDALILIIIFVTGIVVTLAALLLEARPALVQHPEIVIRELKIIFRLHAIAGKLRVAGERLELLVKLGRIATLAVILPVAGIRCIVWRALSAATATPAAALTIIYQT
jgi:hypothetical protein